jgi:integrase/recombinase XerD
MILKRKRIMKVQRQPVAIEHTVFYGYLLRYNEAMTVRNYSPRTLHRRESDIRRFVGWCDERGIDRPQGVTKPILEGYQKHLFYYRQANGEPLSSTSRNHYITSVKQFFKWLTQENHLLYNPASELFVPRQTMTLPTVLTIEEIEQLMQQPEIQTPYGLRDRAILEVLYSTGIRRSELCNLKLHDISLVQLTLYVRKGKGGKDRLLPLGERAAQWLDMYLRKVRPQLLLDINEEVLFLNDYGSMFSDNKLGDRVKRFMKNAGINAIGSCHLLRHAMATHMLENGADIRYIQAMLGHADLTSTQMYTHVSIRKLQEIHAQTHPAKAEDKKILLDQLAAEMDEGISYCNTT